MLYNKAEVINMKRAVAYCRVSTDGQVGDDKFGIESQREQIKEYCRKNWCWNGDS